MGDASSAKTKTLNQIDNLTDRLMDIPDQNRVAGNMMRRRGFLMYYFISPFYSPDSLFYFCIPFVISTDGINK